MSKRMYNNDLPSVTTILGVLRKLGLEFWFKVNSLAFCEAESKRSKEIGTQIHEAIQSHIETNEVKIETQYAEEVTFALRSFMLFKQEHPEVTLEKSEMMLTSYVHGFNGTMDVKGKVSNVPACGDWKSGKCNVGLPKETEKPPIYPEHIFQVAAYVKAYNEVTKENIDRAFIVVLAKDKVAYNFLLLTPEMIESAFYEVFLSCIKIYHTLKVTETYIKQGGK